MRIRRALETLHARVAPAVLAAALIAGSARGQEHYLGPSGMFGVTEPTQILVTKVETGSPAEGKLKPGDVIIGADGTPFRENARRELADAIDEAESKAAKGILTLTIKGREDEPVDLRLTVLGRYSTTAPFNCPKTDAMVTRAADTLVASGDYAKGALCVGWLGLMATGEPKYIDVVKATLPTQPWAHPDPADVEALLKGDKDLGYVGWYWGYRLVTLSEYHLLTGDASVLPAIRTYAAALARGQDAGGLWGHRMATRARNGRLPGYAQINQPSLTCLMGMLMARKCGVKDPDLERGIARTHAFYASFIGRGALNYGVHAPNTKIFNNNGTSGSAAVDMALAGNREGAAFFSRLAAASADGLETGHATHYFNVLWTPIGVSVAGPDVTARFFREARWLYTSYRKWDGGFTFDGKESNGGNSTASLLLACCLPRRVLCITGKHADKSLWLTGQEAVDAVELSRIDYAAFSVDELLAYFDHPVPQVTRRAVWALREKEGNFIPRLVKMIKEGTKIQKQSAIDYFGWQSPAGAGSALMGDLGRVLRDTREDPAVRAAAAGALSRLGEQAYPYYNDMLRLVVADEPGDRFGDVDGSVAASLETLCKNPFEAALVTDKGLFYGAALKLGRNKRQQVRAYGMRMLQGMPLEDFHIVADTVVHVAKDDDPTYQSYHSPGGPVQGAIGVLAALGVREGMQYALGILDVKSGKGSFKMRAVMDSLAKYGANARPIAEKLKTDERFANVENNGKLAKNWKAMIRAVEEDKPPRELIGLEDAVKPAQQ